MLLKYSNLEGFRHRFQNTLINKNKINMDFREAKVEDIKQIQDVRNSVKENKLHDAQSIMRCYGRDYPISELHSLKNMFKMAVNKMNNELACYLRGLAEMSFEKWELDSMYDGLKHRGSGADEVRRLVKNMYPQQNGCVIS